MSYDVMNALTLEGADAQIEQLLTFIQDDSEGIGSIDFEKIIPMPKELDIETSLSEDDAIYMYLAAVNPRMPNMGAAKWPQETYLKVAEQIGGCRGQDYAVQSQAEIKEILKFEKQGSLLKLGKRLVENYQKYGCGDFDEWRVKNWGVRWNAWDCDYDDDLHKLTFSTDHAAAVSIVQKLSEQFPDVKLTLKWIGEDYRSDIGCMVAQNGQFSKTAMGDDPKTSLLLAADFFDLSLADAGLRFDEKMHRFTVLQQPTRETGTPAKKRIHGRGKNDKPKEPER